MLIQRMSVPGGLSIGALLIALQYVYVCSAHRQVHPYSSRSKARFLTGA